MPAPSSRGPGRRCPSGSSRPPGPPPTTRSRRRRRRWPRRESRPAFTLCIAPPLAADLLPDHGPGAPLEVHELGEMRGGRTPLGGEPRRLHAGPIIPVELDDRIPARMVAAGVPGHAVLDVPAEARDA